MQNKLHIHQFEAAFYNQTLISINRKFIIMWDN